jgi:hypothetical protein
MKISKIGKILWLLISTVDVMHTFWAVFSQIHLVTQMIGWLAWPHITQSRLRLSKKEIS